MHEVAIHKRSSTVVPIGGMRLSGCAGVWIKVVTGEDLDSIKAEYLDEITRERAQGHVIPYVQIQLNPSPYNGNPSGSGRITVTRSYRNVAVSPHNLRSIGTSSLISKPFQAGVVTANDVLYSLKDLGKLTVVSASHSRISRAITSTVTM